MTGSDYQTPPPLRYFDADNSGVFRNPPERNQKRLFTAFFQQSGFAKL